MSAGGRTFARALSVTVHVLPQLRDWLYPSIDRIVFTVQQRTTAWLVQTRAALFGVQARDTEFDVALRETEYEVQERPTIYQVQDDD